MSKVEDIYEKIETLVTSTLTGYVRLPNPYVIDVNTHLHMRKGFGLAVGPGNDTQRFIDCLMTWERVFTIVLVNQVTTTQNNTSSRVLLEKSLLDDHEALTKAVYLNSALDGVAIKTTILDDRGIAFIDGERLKFLSLEMSLYVEYLFDPRT